MGASLALLTVFIGLWLQKAYQDEYDRLQEQTNFLFLNSVREMEDGLFQELLVNPIALAMHSDSNQMKGERVVVHRQFDSTKVLYFQQKEEWVDSNLQVSIRAKLDPAEGEKPIRGSMAFVIALAEGEKMVDSIPYRLDSLDVWPLLDTAVRKTFGESDLPHTYQLIRREGADSLHVHALLSTSYEDILKGINMQ
ncbi:MAG: hypothetical protein IPJ40_02825 [Saprospirales bacterium]|nr:hypothetical protein [Saprospirales bacterium]